MEYNKRITNDSLDVIKKLSGELSKKLIKESKLNKILIDTIKIDSITKIYSRIYIRKFIFLVILLIKTTYTR